MSAPQSKTPLTEEQRLRRVREELERRIDADLGYWRAEPVQLEPQVLARFAAYLSLKIAESHQRAAESYQRTAVGLSIFVTGVTVINVLVATKLL